jgi:NADH-ubiquinone oxidoreductase chain 2
MIFLSIMFIIVALALPNLKNGFGALLMTRITSLVFIYSCILSLNSFYISQIKSGIGIYSGLFHVSTVSQLSEIFFLVVASLILLAMRPSNLIGGTAKSYNKYLISQKDTNNEVNYLSEYSLVVLFSTLGTTLLVSSYDLISLYLSIELQSFGVYILTTLYRNSEKASNAGLMYFLLGGLSSCLILLGSGLIYSFTGLTNLEGIYSLISVYDNSTQGFTLGIVLIVIGLLFKIAAAPFHNWSPSVYDNSPTIVTIWLTIMPKIGVLIFLLDLITQSNTTIVFGEVGLLSYNTVLSSYASDFINYKDSIKGLLLVSSALSLIIGTVVGLAQTRIKRLLAYSTISHIGFMLLSLAINTEQSIEALIFYIIQYTISNLTIFLVIIGLGYLMNNTLNKSSNYNQNSDKDIEFIAEIKGQFFYNPILSLSFTICLFSMAGVPPLIGFFGKQFVLYSAVQSGYYFISILAILVSVISASYYLKIIKLLHTDSDKINLDIFNNSANKDNSNFAGVQSQISNFHSFTISALTLTILFFVIKPSILINSTQLLSLSLFNF